MTATPIFSDLSSNHQEAVIQECLFLNGTKVGCAVVPYQNIFLGPWIEFPMAPNLVPVNHGKGLITLIDGAEELYLLIETATMPTLNNVDEVLMVGFKICFIFSILLTPVLLYRWKIMGYRLPGKLTHESHFC